MPAHHCRNGNVCIASNAGDRTRRGYECVDNWNRKDQKARSKILPGPLGDIGLRYQAF